MEKQLNLKSLNIYNSFLSNWNLLFNNNMTKSFNNPQKIIQELNDIYQNYILSNKQIIYVDKSKSLQVIQEFLSYELLYASPACLLKEINQLNNLLFSYYKYYIRIIKQTETSYKAVKKSFVTLFRYKF